jgi:hypothetical protein
MPAPPRLERHLVAAFDERLAYRDRRERMARVAEGADENA